MIAVRGSLIESEAKIAYDRLTQYLEKNGGKITFEESWGKIGLAYNIAKETEAHYFVFHVMYDTQKIEALEELLQIDADIIRSLITKIENDDYKPFTKAQYEAGIDAYRATKQERQKVAMPKTRATTAVQLEADMKKMKPNDNETKIGAIMKDLTVDL